MIIAGWECGVQTLFNNFGNLKKKAYLCTKYICRNKLVWLISLVFFQHARNAQATNLYAVHAYFRHSLFCVLFMAKEIGLFSKGSKDRKSIMFKTDHGWRKNLNDKEILLFSIDLRNFSLFFSTPKIRYYWLNHPSPHAPLFLLCSKYFYLLLQCWLQEKEHYALSKP